MSYTIEVGKVVYKLERVGAPDIYLLAALCGCNNLIDEASGKVSRSWQVCAMGDHDSFLTQCEVFADSAARQNRRPLRGRAPSFESYMNGIRKKMKSAATLTDFLIYGRGDASFLQRIKLLLPVAEIERCKADFFKVVTSHFSADQIREQFGRYTSYESASAETSHLTVAIDLLQSDFFFDLIECDFPTDKICVSSVSQSDDLDHRIWDKLKRIDASYVKQRLELEPSA